MNDLELVDRKTTGYTVNTGILKSYGGTDQA